MPAAGRSCLPVCGLRGAPPAEWLCDARGRRAARAGAQAQRGGGRRCWEAEPPPLSLASAPIIIPPPSSSQPPRPAVNRRMDEWVPLDNFNLDTVCPPEPAEPGEGGRTRNQKRKVDDDHRRAPYLFVCFCVGA